MIMPETSGPDVTDQKKNSQLWKTKLNNIVLGGGPENSLQVLYCWSWWTRGGEDCGGCLLPQLDHSLLQCSIAEERNAWQQCHIINITTIFMTYRDIANIVWFNRKSRFDTFDFSKKSIWHNRLQISEILPEARKEFISSSAEHQLWMDATVTLW